MSRRMMMAANWKMHKTISEAINLAVRLKYACNSVDDRDVVLCPPFTALEPAVEAVDESPVEVGAQNMHYEDAGAYTGEVSPPMVKDTGAEWVILGHSERREYFHEDEDLLRRKLNAALDHDLSVFYCIGETEEQREAGQVEPVLREQLSGVLEGFNRDELSDFVVAYEPIWAIGTGQSAEPSQANEAHATVRELLDELVGEGFGESTRVIYGGSVKPHNVDDLMAQPHLDGALVGSASLNAEDFSAIAKYDLEDDVVLP